ncbi:hypothetical protein CXG81DRAFT_28370 [Caulochytrium protostelioides]|uniref:Acetyl-CoA synthetase-like protein n=1 Tax=Caulochytrium protostelioides TaxID=1555241 RepID=A0A4P9X1P5_9FUNG|nr:hypothetical protein CXG81DRAFT_28370 [Caulochytrium protostelioides]|eukprot:RKO98828.1 hypothetical protein CXG81DRAFT_28370 [Caulochytrium protostelioides]
MDQKQLHQQAAQDPEAFWGAAAKDIRWIREPTQVLDRAADQHTSPGWRWFPDGQLNTCANCVDRHVDEGHGDRTALIWDSTVAQAQRRMTYAQLLVEVNHAAHMLREEGLRKGDAVIIYMPMIPEAVVAMLACARLGAVHSVVFGGFAPAELAKRITDCAPTFIIAANCGREPKREINYLALLRTAIAQSGLTPKKKIYYFRPFGPTDLQPGEASWDELIQNHLAGRASVTVAPEPMAASDPLYLLYTSGSTGVPKGVVREHGPNAVQLRWTMQHVFGMRPGDVFFAASDIGWVVGHSFIVYGPLLSGLTTVLFEGKPTYPNAGVFWRIVRDYGVHTLYTAPTALRAVKREDPEGELIPQNAMPTLRNIFLVGERTDPDTILHFQDRLQIPLRDTFWQTETGSIVASSMAMPAGQTATTPIPGVAGLPVPGWDVVVLDETTGQPYPRPTTPGATTPVGNLAVRTPLPPGAFPTLWRNHAGYMASYFKKFPGFYDLSDAGIMDADGRISVLARTDDLINTAGHRLSTGGMEEIVAGHPAIAECAVVGIRDELKGEVPICFAVFKRVTPTAPTAPGSTAAAATDGDEEAVRVALQKKVRAEMGAFACFTHVYFVHNLPKTRSGKVLRRTLRAICNGQAYQIPPTIEDDHVLVEIETLVRRHNQGQAASKL